MEASGIGRRNALPIKDSINKCVGIGRYHSHTINPCLPKVNGSTLAGVECGCDSKMVKFREAAPKVVEFKSPVHRAG